MPHLLKGVLILAAISAGLAACGRDAAFTSQVSGEAFYLQKIALPDDAVLTVQLVDVSLQDVQSKLMAEQRIELDGRQQPFEFKLKYDPGKLVEGHVYAVSGRIEDSSGLRFINTEQHALLLTGEPLSLRLKLDQVTPAGPAEALAVKPEFFCSGNEPFWHLELTEDTLKLSRLQEEVIERTYHGRYSRYSGLEGVAGYEWQGESTKGRDSRLVADLTAEHCEDSMAGDIEGKEYDYSLRMLVDDEELAGCCNLLGPQAGP